MGVHDVGEANAIRHRVTYRDHSLYVSIVPSKAEVFITSALETESHTGAAIDALTRLTSLAWKHTTLDTVITQLQRASRTPKDLPGILARLLAEDDFGICTKKTP